MHPVLLNKKLSELLPANIYKALHQPAFLEHWYWWLIGLVVSFGIAWWGLAPDAKGGRRAIGWFGTLGAFAFALTLGAVGLSRLRYVQLHTYGVLVAVGFLVGIVLAVREARRVGINIERILDLAFWLLIAAMVGARLFYIGLHWKIYQTDFMNPNLVWYQWKVFRLWEGGLLYYGGFLLALAVCFIFIKFYKLSFWSLSDLMIPSVAIGQFFGYLGSYAAGFGYGIHTSVPWSVTFSQGAAVRGLPLHPTQLYGALGALFLFFILLWVRSEKKYDGQVFLWYLLLYPVISFVIELFTAESSKTFLIKAINNNAGLMSSLSWSQAISIVLFVIAFFYLINKSNQESPVTSA